MPAWQRHSTRHDLLRALALVGEHVIVVDKHKGNTFDWTHMILQTRSPRYISGAEPGRRLDRRLPFLKL
jgi:hypothetical protein